MERVYNLLDIMREFGEINIAKCIKDDGEWKLIIEGKTMKELDESGGD